MRLFVDTPLAIIGMACRLPGANNLDEFWQLLVEGRCAITAAPPERLNRQRHYDPQASVPYKTYIASGGLITYAPFDATLCPVPRHTLPEAEIGHLTICQVAAQACRHAGLNPFDLPLRNVGVYVGHNLGGPMTPDIVYGTLVETAAQYLREVDPFREATGSQADALIQEIVRRVRDSLPRRGPAGTPEGATRFAATMISEALGLSGPSMILDAACSSALQGLAMASRGLQLGRIDMAIVGGASYYHVDSQIIFSRAQSASPRAVCCPFDADADGLVSGEGYVAIVVKTLERAQADGDPIQCVIRGIGVSSDGRGKSLWAPRKEGQLLAIRRAYEHGLDLGRLQFVEAHATSTRVGDMTELKALAEVLDGHISAAARIPLGGVKANIGHTLESAGLAGLVKTVLAMKHQTVPRQIAVRNLNHGIDWEAVPFYVPMENVAWPEFKDGHPRRAAVNSFGIGGLNVHVVIDERLEKAPRAGTAKPRHATAGPGGGQEPVAIVGAGCIFPGARTLTAFWELISSGRDPKSDVPLSRWNSDLAFEPGSRKPWRSPTRRGGFITDFECDWRRHKIPPNQLGKADPLQLMILDATDAALADAGYDKSPYDKSRVGVVVGTLFGSDFGEQLEMGFRIADFCETLAMVLRRQGTAEGQIAAISKSYGEVLLKHMPALLDETGSFTPSTLASRITKMYDLMGGAVTIDAGHASSLAAVYSAVDTLLDDSCDMVICAAGSRAMGLCTYEGLSLTGQLADDQSPAPFAAGARGHLPGEGVGVIVLKRLADARRDGNLIRGIIRGVGTSFSANRTQAVRQAILRAEEAAGEPAAKELILETSGIGVEEVDSQEIAAVAGNMSNVGRSAPLVVSSLVGQIGHTQGASGMASLLAAIRALDELEVVPCFGMTAPSGLLARPGSPLRLATSRLRLAPPGDSAAQAGVNNLDSFGSAYHLLLERGAPTPICAPAVEIPGETPATGAWRIVRLGATSVPALIERARRAVDECDVLYQTAASLRFGPAEFCRLAIVAESGADLCQKLNQAVAQLGTPKAAMLSRHDVYYGELTDPVGKVAFLFSGQGSQYVGMLKPLTEQFPPAAEAMHRIDARLAELRIPSFANFAWENPQGLGTDVWITQLSLLCADTILFHSLQSLGIRPDYIAGHSFGEFPALAAAGAWDFGSAVLGTRARCQAIEVCRQAGGGMLSVAADGVLVERICKHVGGKVFPANYNAPDQTVVGGDDESLAQLERQLRAEKIAFRRLAVPRPFHTSLMADVTAPLAHGLAPIEMHAPRVPLLSSVTNRQVSSPEEMRSNLIAQMTAPVRYVDLIAGLVERGVRAIVEVGPQQILTGLHQKILAKRDVAAIATDDKARGGMARLLAAQACLEVRGILDQPPASPAIDVFETVAAPVGQAEPRAEPAAAFAAGRNGEAAAPAAETPLEFTGTAYEIGRAHGQALAAEIRSVARRFADMSGIEWDSGRTADFAQFEDFSIDLLTVDEQEELRGIADGAGVSAEMLAVYNAWSDRRLADGTAQVAMSSGEESLHAFDEQASGREPWGDLGIPQILRVYRPDEGLAHAVVAWPGMLGASAGINQHALAVTSTAGHGATPRGSRTCLRTALVRRILAQASDIDSAVHMLQDAANDLAGEFCISHPSSKTIRCLRFGAGLRPKAIDQNTIVSITEAQAPEPAGVSSSADAVDVSVLPADRPLRTHYSGLFRALGEHTGNGGPLPPSDRRQLADLAETHLAVLMHPGRREIIFRRNQADGRRSTGCYQFAPIAQAPNASPEVGPAKIEKPSSIAVMALPEYLAATQSTGGQPPFDTRGMVCQRYVMRMLQTPLPEIDESLRKLNGPSLIVGRNPVGLALRKQIEAMGSVAVVVPLVDDAEKTLAAVDKIWAAYRPLHLFIVTPFDDGATTVLKQDAWERRRLRGVMLPFLVCQRWFSHVADNKLVEKASVVAATAMGGDFGLSGRISGVECGALTGLVKALCIEFGWTTKWAFRTKVVDAPLGELPDDVAMALLRELRSRAPVVEVGYAKGRRHVIGVFHKPIQALPDKAPTAGRPWIVTGGARGITAAIARELGTRFGVKLHLVGTSPRPQCDPAWRNLTPEGRQELRARLTRQAIADKKLPVEVWKGVEKAIEIDATLCALEAAGTQAAYHACDVSDREAMTRLLEGIRRTDGPIEGIVHGAGIEVASRFAKKDPQSVSQTIAAKVDGAALLMELTRDDAPRYFFGFGSISGKWGSIGQADYALASDMLAKLINWYRAQRPDCHALCIHWQPWADIGMAAREETRGGQMLQGVKLLPAAEGVQLFIEELLAGVPESEVVVTEWEYYKRYCPDLSADQVAAIFGGDLATRPAAAPRPAAPPRRDTAQPSAAASPVRPAPAVVPRPQNVAHESSRVASRQVMRMLEIPRESTTRRTFAFSGLALIVGDNDDARALARCLVGRGVAVRQLPIHETIDGTLAEMQRIFAEKQVLHLFLMTGRDPDAAVIDSQEAWKRRRERGVLLPFKICQQWLGLITEAKLLDRASLVAVTSLGGDFGFSRAIVAPEGGALTGLLKGINMEVIRRPSSSMKLKLIDAPPHESPDELAAAVLDELDVEGFDVEVAFETGRRHVVRLIVEPVEELPQHDLTRGGTWVFTGGARGITAAVARQIAPALGLKVHLLGASPLPQLDDSVRNADEAQLQVIKRGLVRRAMSEGVSAGTHWERLRKDLEIDRTLRDLTATGVRVTYHQCDASNWTALARTLEKVRSQDGPIEGIVHGAGISGPSKSITATAPDILDEMVGVKVDAALGLMLLTRQDPVHYFVGFGSISGRFGTADASTYTLGNDMLCKLIGWYRGLRPECLSVGFHWHPWGEVGMMTLPVSQHTIKVFKMKMMPPSEGIDHLVGELRAGAPEREVLITDFQFGETFFSKDLVISRPAGAAPVASPKQALIERIAERERGRRVVAEIRLNPVDDPFLREHRLRDRPTLPLVVALESFFEAASLVEPGTRQPVACRNVEITDAVRFFSDEPVDIRVTGEMTPEGVQCRLTSDFRNRRGQIVQKDRLHFSGLVETIAGHPTLDAKLPPRPGDWFDIAYPPAGGAMFHGSPLRLLRRASVNETTAMGEIHLPRKNDLVGRRDAGGWLTPSAAIDACLYACGVYVWVYAGQAIAVPQGLRELRFGRPGRPGETTVVHLSCRNLEQALAAFDFTLFGDDGAVIFQARQYRCHVLRGPVA
jgi:acyl transferase domain-containing protein/NAD(P)-dependent dehydrogenase (short-subunit alcohol dehydrogenase family)